MRKGFFLPFDSIEDLDDIGAEDAWSVIKALSDYYRGGAYPQGLTGEARLCLVAIIERG